MKILALELSTARGSAAWRDEGTRAEETWPNDRKHSGAFFAAIKAFLERYGIPETIMVGLGPGSYAGVRIAISAAIGLEAASRGRLIGLPSICAMTTGARRFHVIGDARRQTFYLAEVNDRRLVREPELMSESELGARMALLDGNVPIISSDALPQFSQVQSAFPSAATLAELAQNVNNDFSLPPLQPMYLREPHITQPRRAISSVPTS